MFFVRSSKWAQYRSIALCSHPHVKICFKIFGLWKLNAWFSIITLSWCICKVRNGSLIWASVICNIAIFERWKSRLSYCLKIVWSCVSVEGCHITLRESYAQYNSCLDLQIKIERVFEWFQTLGFLPLCRYSMRCITLLQFCVYKCNLLCDVTFLTYAVIFAAKYLWKGWNYCLGI